MEIVNRYLTPMDQKALWLLSEGRSYRIVKDETGINSQRFGIFMAKLRKKTGIEDTQDVQQVRSYLASLHNGEPTPKQLEILNRVAGTGPFLIPHTIESLAMNLQISKAEAEAKVADACAAVGIMAKDERERRVQIKMYMADRKTVVKGVERLSHEHIAVLREYAEGAHVEYMERMGSQFHVNRAKLLLKEGLSLLGICARGRGVQRRLVTIALKRAERESMARTAPTMDDPAF